MTSLSLNFFSNQIQCSHVFLIIQFPESFNLKQSYFIADETRDFPCIPFLPENFQSVPPVFFIRPRDPPWYVTLVLMTFLTGTEDNSHKVLTLEIVQYKSYSIQLKTACTLNFCPRHFRNKVHRLGTVISGTIRMFRCCHCINSEFTK